MTDDQRKAFVKHVTANYEKSDRLATWVGDQLFAKAGQTLALTGKNGGPIEIKGVNITAPWPAP